MIDINTIRNDGFFLRDLDDDTIDIAGLSLRTSLQAYFSTYHCLRGDLHSLFDAQAQPRIDVHSLNYPVSYYSACTEAINHFQHFAELIIKQLLRLEHPLLVNVARDNVVILHKLLNDEKLTPEEEKGIKTVEFSEALARFQKLFKAGRIGQNGSLNFINEAVQWLRQVNALRNRVLHRGTYILHYPALDQLFGGYILPFIRNMSTLNKISRRQKPSFKAYVQNFWRYKPLTCKIDPIEAIIDEFQQGQPYNLKKVAVLKELGRAAYERPEKVAIVKGRLATKKRQAEELAKLHTQNEGIDEIKICPVCGASSLLTHYELEHWWQHFEPEECSEIVAKNPAIIEENYKNVCRVKCTYCTFELDWNIGFPSEYGLDIEDYWLSTKISDTESE